MHIRMKGKKTKKTNKLITRKKNEFSEFLRKWNENEMKMINMKERKYEMKMKKLNERR